jgi:hypothetical protein
MPYDNIRNHHCTECGEQSAHVRKERKCTYRLENPNRGTVCVTRIDECYITDGIRCDYLFVDCLGHGAYFVELKGSDFLHAVDQIQSTINLLQADLDGLNIFARIVATKIAVPNLQNSPNVLKLRKKLKLLSGDLKYATIFLTETI